MILTGSSGLSEFIGDRCWVDTAEFFASATGVEQPLDAGSLGVASALPVLDLTAQGFPVCDTPVQTLLVQHPDFDLHHVEPARMLGYEMKLQPAQNLASDLGGEDFVQRRRFVRREIIEHDANRLGMR